MPAMQMIVTSEQLQIFPVYLSSIHSKKDMDFCQLLYPMPFCDFLLKTFCDERVFRRKYIRRHGFKN